VNPSSHGWREKDTLAAMLFGRASERALGAYFFPERLVSMALDIEGFKPSKLQKSCLSQSP
jgi:hypothetical protein